MCHFDPLWCYVSPTSHPATAPEIFEGVIVGHGRVQAHVLAAGRVQGRHPEGHDGAREEDVLHVDVLNVRICIYRFDISWNYISM